LPVFTFSRAFRLCQFILNFWLILELFNLNYFRDLRLRLSDQDWCDFGFLGIIRLYLNRCSNQRLDYFCYLPLYLYGFNYLGYLGNCGFNELFLLGV